MLPPDVIQFKQFYSSRLGERVSEMIMHALLELWPSAKNDVMLVVGFAAPYMAHYANNSAALLMCMQAEQGAAAWPANAPNRVALTHDAELPFQSNSINRVLLIHSVEHSENLNAMMQEVYRVLVPGGRVLAVVPNRVSMWAGSSKSPFGFGRPFNLLQLRALLTSHQFTITRCASALFMPPIIAKLSRKLSQKIEPVGRICWWFMGGVLLQEAEKQLYASIKEPAYARKPYRLGVIAPQPAGISKKD